MVTGATWPKLYTWFGRRRAMTRAKIQATGIKNHLGTEPLQKLNKWKLSISIPWSITKHMLW